jgi:hypothetical protein
MVKKSQQFEVSKGKTFPVETRTCCDADVDGAPKKTEKDCLLGAPTKILSSGHAGV